MCRSARISSNSVIGFVEERCLALGAEYEGTESCGLQWSASSLGKRFRPSSQQGEPESVRFRLRATAGAAGDLDGLLAVVVDAHLTAFVRAGARRANRSTDKPWHFRVIDPLRGSL